MVISQIFLQANCVQKGICAGKNSVAEYLVENHAFTRLHLAQDLPLEDSVCLDGSELVEQTFETIGLLLEFVTKRWQQRWVTTDVWNEDVLENLLRRPFFLLVSIDAPVILRWKRLQERRVGIDPLRDRSLMTSQVQPTWRNAAYSRRICNPQ